MVATLTNIEARMLKKDEDATVEAEVVQHKKAKKVVVFKMQPKKHTRSKVGHRQHQTTIKVTKISA